MIFIINEYAILFYVVFDDIKIGSKSSLPMRVLIGDGFPFGMSQSKKLYKLVSSIQKDVIVLGKLCAEGIN